MIALTIEQLVAITGKQKEELLKLTKNEDGSDADTSELGAKVVTWAGEKMQKIKTEAAAQSLKNGIEKREKAFATKFGIDTYENWDDLLEQASAKVKEGSQADTELAEKLKATKSKIAELENKYKQALQEKEAIKSDFENKSLLARAESIAQQHILSLNLNLPTDPAKRAAAIKKLVSFELAGKKLKEDGGKIYFVGDDGEIVEDDTMNPLEITKAIERGALDIYQVATGNNGGNGQPLPPNGANGSNFTKEDLTPENYAKKAAALQQAGDKAGFEALNKAYKEEHYK